VNNDEINEIKRIVESNDINEKKTLISYLENLLCNEYRKISNANEVIELLIYYAINEKDDWFREELFNVISSAVLYQDIQKVNFDLIESNLQNLSFWCLKDAISILGYSQNKKYIPTIKSYLNHEEKGVVATAMEALEEIQNKE